MASGGGVPGRRGCAGLLGLLRPHGLCPLITSTSPSSPHGPRPAREPQLPPPAHPTVPNSLNTRVCTHTAPDPQAHADPGAGRPVRAAGRGPRCHGHGPGDTVLYDTDLFSYSTPGATRVLYSFIDGQRHTSSPPATADARGASPGPPRGVSSFSLGSFPSRWPGLNSGKRGGRMGKAGPGRGGCWRVWRRGVWTEEPPSG